MKPPLILSPAIAAAKPKLRSGGAGAVVRGCGACVPDRIVANDDLPDELETSDAWIRERTGIRQRHIADDNQSAADLATQACRHALDDAGMNAADIDLIVLATATPDYTFPATAALVQKNLGVGAAAAFDLQAVCSGFVYALTVGDALLRNGIGCRALVIGADVFSRILDWNDRTTCTLFGDGAGAVAIEAVSVDSEDAVSIDACGQPRPRGLLGADLNADGRFWDRLYVDGGPSTTNSVGKLRMKGKEVFRHAVANGVASVKTLMAQSEYELDDVDWLIPHQANQRILDATADALNIDRDKVVSTVDRYANTSAASIPLSLDFAVRQGRVKRGDLVVFQAMGGGFAWGSVLARW